MTTEKKWALIVDVLFLGVILAVAYVCLKYVAGWLLPFIIAVIIAALLQRPINWLLRHTKAPRRIVAPIVTLILVLCCVGLLALVAVQLTTGLLAFVSGLPSLLSETAPQLLESLNTRFDRLIVAMPREWEAALLQLAADLTTNLQNWLLSFSARLVGWTANRAAKLPMLLVSFLITLIATFFMTSDYKRVTKFLAQQVPRRHAHAVSGIWRAFWGTLRKMLQSYLLIMLITYAELFIGLLVLRVEYFFVLAALIATLDILPIVGVGTVLIPWGLISIVLGNTTLGVGLLVLYVIIYVVRNIIEPKIVGTRIGLPPVVMLIAMYVGVRLIGLFGIFLFPLLLILLKKAQDEGVLHIWNTGDPDGGVS